MKLANLNDLLVDQIRDIYFAEKHLTKALPKMARAATSDDLKEAFNHHLDETRNHVTRLEQVFEMLDQAPKAKRCPAIIGLVEEGGEMIDENADPEVRDAGLIAAAQRVEHYEIAAYGCARAFAKRLGLDDVAEILSQTIEEEGAADHKLTELAEGHINDDAVAAAHNGSQRVTPQRGRNGRNRRPSQRSARRRASAS